MDKVQSIVAKYCSKPNEQIYFDIDEKEIFDYSFESRDKLKSFISNYHLRRKSLNINFKYIKYKGGTVKARCLTSSK